MTDWRGGQLGRDRAGRSGVRRVHGRFDIGTNKTIATLRLDGAPRISASELDFAAGEVTLGMMGGSMKLLGVRRDPRIAVHSPTLEPPSDDPTAWPGDAKAKSRGMRSSSSP